MSATCKYSVTLVAALCVLGTGCDTTISTSLPDSSAPPSGLSEPEGVDPRNPNVERTSMNVDFSGVRTIRVELPTGRVVVSQADGSAAAGLRTTEFITVEGLSYEVLEELHTRTAVIAERSFVDETRLDIEAGVAEGLADADVLFDVRLVIPNGASIEVLLANGPVQVSDLTGNVEIRTANGPVVIERVSGNVVAQTSLRPITVTDVTGNVQVRTTDADVTLRLTPPTAGRVAATTTNGIIRMTIPTATAASLSLSAPDGVVTANLAGFQVSNIAVGSGLLSGVLNGGGGQIEAQVMGGEIEFGGM